MTTGRRFFEDRDGGDMVPTTRRQLLGGGLLAGLAGAGAFLPADWLPHALAVQRVRLRPVPELTVRPPVTADHADAARVALADAVDRAERAVDRLGDVTATSVGIRPESSLSSAKRSLEQAEDRDGWKALSGVRRGVKFAGEAVGAARVLEDDVSGEALAERARQLQVDVDAVAGDVTYDVSDPSRGLARLYFVEKWLGLGRLNSYRSGTYLGQDEPATEYDPRQAVRTWGSHWQARRYVADARRLLADYRAEVDGTRRLDDHVAAASAALYDEAARLTPDPEEFDRRTAELEAMDESPARTLRWQLFSARQTADVRAPGGLWAGLALYRAVENAGTVLTCRGATDARERAALEPGESVTAKRLSTAKREGLRLLDARREAAADRPMLEFLLQEPRRLLWAGDTELDGDYDVAHPEARAYGKYLRAVGYLRSVREVAARLDRPDGG